MEKIVNREVAMRVLVLAKHCFIGECLLARVKINVEREWDVDEKIFVCVKENTWETIKYKRSGE